MKFVVVLVCLVGVIGALASAEVHPVFDRCTDNRISGMLQEAAGAPPITIKIYPSTQQSDCGEIHRGKANISVITGMYSYSQSHWLSISRPNIIIPFLPMAS